MEFWRLFNFHKQHTHSLDVHLLVMLLIRAVSLTTPLRLVMLDVPSPTVVGQEVELTCSFDLNGDTLYSVKWYKDDVEFYRFVPNDWPPGQFLPLSGVRVDLSKSKEQSVYIRTVALETAGVYKCEVSTEAPVFDTVSAKKEMNVYVLPTEGPKITGRHMKYRVGDTVTVNCTSAKSKPAASLAWYINDKKVGADYETVYSTILHDDGLEVSCLSLRFLITSDHFTNGNMRLKCEASIPRVRYTMSDEALVISEQLQHVSGLQIRENLSKGLDHSPLETIWHRLHRMPKIVLLERTSFFEKYSQISVKNFGGEYDTEAYPKDTQSDCNPMTEAVMKDD